MQDAPASVPRRLARRAHPLVERSARWLPRSVAPECRVSPVGCWLKDILVGVRNRPVTDALVDAIRGGIAEISKQKAEAPADVEQMLTHRRDAGAGVASAAQLRRGVDAADANAVRRDPAYTRHR